MSAAPPSFHQQTSEGEFYPFIQVVDEDIEQDWIQHWPLGNAAYLIKIPQIKSYFYPL